MRLAAPPEELGGRLHAMPTGLERRQHVGAQTRLHVCGVVRIARQERADQEAWALDGFLHVQAVVEQVAQHLNVEHRLSVAAHRGEAEHRAIVARRDGGHQRVEGPLARGEDRRVRRIHGEVPSPVVQDDPGAQRGTPLNRRIHRLAIVRDGRRHRHDVRMRRRKRLSKTCQILNV